MITVEYPRDIPPHKEALSVIDAREAAALLGVSRATLYRQLHKMPPRVRLSSRRFGWRASDLMKWLAAQRETI